MPTLTLARQNTPTAVGSIFQCACRRGANRNDSVAALFRYEDRFRGSFGNAVTLGMDAVIFHTFDPNRLKGSQTGVQSQANGADPLAIKFRQELLGEMQTGSRGGHCSRTAEEGTAGR